MVVYLFKALLLVFCSGSKLFGLGPEVWGVSFKFTKCTKLRQIYAEIASLDLEVILV